jgi:acetoin utilization deacetylase AcuC-like enzyme
MNLYAVPSLEHKHPSHPESALRIPAILKALEDDPQLWAQVEQPPLPPPATDDQLARIHDRDYLANLRRVMSQAPAYIDHAPTYITPRSYDCAAQAAGAAMAAVESAIKNQQSSMALIRPPGHHAPPGQAMGFCLFNNIAIAARHAQGLGHNKIMIYDFDVHHGNGTQDAFYSDSSVLFISSHQSGIYPMTGYAPEIGEGDGLGYTVNVPLPAGVGDTGFGRIVNEIVAPAAERFKPDLILISAGYDAHWRDPLASLQLSCTGYHTLAARLTQLANQYCAGKVVFILEGGYDLPALSQGVRNTLRGTIGLPVEDPLGPAPEPEPDLETLLAKLKSLHKL